MSDSDKRFGGAIPEIYDTYLVPLIFESYAADLAARVADGPCARVLETAAGSGVVTRALAPRLAADAQYTVTDLNQPMLDRAMRRQAPDARLTWRQADALHLPFADASFDVVCCQFGVMFFPDRVAGYREAMRTLRPGGRLVFSTWDRIEENEFADEVTRAVGAMFPREPPQFLRRTPHGYGDTGQIATDLRAAGFRAFDIETLAMESRAASPREPAIAYCQGTPMRNEIEAHTPALLDLATSQAEHAIRTRFGDGSVSGRIQAHVVVAAR